MTLMTEHEVKAAYDSLKKAIKGARDRDAALMLRNLLSVDPNELWKFLLTGASSEISHTDKETAVFVRTMYENWRLYQDPVFAVNAVLVLISAPKGASAQDYILRRTD
jgi:hypothetical protein